MITFDIPALEVIIEKAVAKALHEQITAQMAKHAASASLPTTGEIASAQANPIEVAPPAPAPAPVAPPPPAATTSPAASGTVTPLNAVPVEVVRAAFNKKVQERKSSAALALLKSYGVTAVVELNPQQLQEILPRVEKL